jgi:NAD+-dependent protein deacetylase SIR2
LHDIDQLTILTGPHVCTPEESDILRRRLTEIGIPAFVRETLGTGAYSAKKLCSAFRISIPPFLEGASDEAQYQLLGLVLLQERQRRLRLPQYQTIDDAAKLLQKSKNIMVITGAGVRTTRTFPDQF